MDLFIHATPKQAPVDNGKQNITYLNGQWSKVVLLTVNPKKAPPTEDLVPRASLLTEMKSREALGTRLTMLMHNM